VSLSIRELRETTKNLITRKEFLMAERELIARENMLLAARMSHNNEIIDVAEVLNETNDVIQDAVVQRANDITSHVVARRTALPTSTWVKIGNGWNATTGRLQQARETIGQLKARYQCPQDVMRLQPNPAKYRMQQERTYIESMGQEFANTLVAGSTTGEPPEEFDGLLARYPTISSNDATYVVNNGASSGTGASLTSIWFIQWRPGGVYLIYPRNAEGGGIKKEDKGLNLTSGDNSVASTSATQPNPTNQLWAYITEFSWDVGLCIEDTRTVKRLCNISTASATDSNTLDEDNIIQVRNNFKTPGTIYMYCNETIFTQLQILAKDKSNVHYPPDTPFGKPQMYFLDMPVRRLDGIATTETLVTT
jgi:hypothetical protein